MKKYIRLDRWLGNSDPLPFATALAEVAENGTVDREIGLDGEGHVVYKCPCPFPTSKHRGFRGICDMATFATQDKPNDVEPRQFELLWAALLDQDVEDKSIEAIKGPSLVQRLTRLWKGRD